MNPPARSALLGLTSCAAERGGRMKTKSLVEMRYMTAADGAGWGEEVRPPRLVFTRVQELRKLITAYR
ncbi:hypothetical protein HC931_19870 [Candidatus Gracilibacteria bacterium]|nr:hypothetical protein [Candidatus Gracilibacteria bacterium]